MEAPTGVGSGVVVSPSSGGGVWCPRKIFRFCPSKC